MKHADFKIGETFTTNGGKCRWRVTDVGTRSIAAIRLNRLDTSWFIGPPYAVKEIVFDEYDQEGCAAEFGGLTEEE